MLTGRNAGVVKVIAVSNANNEIIKTTDITVYDPVKKAGLSTTKGVVSRSGNAKGLTLSAYATGVLPNMSKNSATGVKPGERPTITFTTDERYLKLTQVDGDPASVVITAAEGTGNVKNIQFLIGQSMRELRGKADPKTVKDILEKLLSEMK